MQSARKVLLPLLAALLAGGALAATPAAGRTAARTGQQAQAQPGAARTLAVTYYRGDPLNGGQLLGTRTVTPQPGERPFQNAPGGATHAVVTTPFGKRVVNLSEAQNQARPGGTDGRPGEGPDGAPPQGQRGAAQGGATDDAARPQGNPGPLGGALRGATRVTFYTADPLQGGRAIRSVTLSGNGANQQAAITQAAGQARFAVVERPGERVVVDLSAAAGQPGRTAPQGTGRQ